MHDDTVNCLRMC